MNSAQFARTLQRNVSLYFPFLAYYHISFFRSDLFDVPRLGGLAQSGFPGDLEDALGDSSAAAALTLKALVSGVLIAADPDGLTARSTLLFANLLADDWLRLDWKRELDCSTSRRFCWPVFGALATLRDSAWPPAEFCFAATSFSEALQKAVQSNEAVDLMLSLDFLEMPPASCGHAGADVLRAAASLAVADWVRQAAAQEGVDPDVSAVQDAVGTAQDLLQSFAGSPLLGLASLSAAPGGAELLWLLDRLQCASEVAIDGKAHRSWLGAENIGMKNDVDIRYVVSVFPHRELVSDFLRARQVPYCNESILRAAQRLARRLQQTGARSVRVVEVGANLGDCSLWIARRLQAVPSLRSIKVIALEAVPSAATLFAQSVQRNDLAGIIQVQKVAAGARRGKVRLQAKPMSSNSFTASEAEAKDAAISTEALDDIVPYASIDMLISHTNGQELSILRGAKRLMRSRKLVVILQLYGADTGIIRDASYDPARPVRWLVDRGFQVSILQRMGQRVSAPGKLRRLTRQRVMNVLAIPRTQRRRLLASPLTSPQPPARECLDLTVERPNSWAEVDGRVLRENLHIVRMYLTRTFGEAPPMGAVLKANAYGHGAVLAGRVFASAKIDALFVSEIETGLMLRTAPEVSMALPLVLLYRAPGRDSICALAKANITVSVLSMAWLREAVAWPACALRLRLHLMVDTGLNREGLAVQEVAEGAALVLGMWPHWSLDGFYTHWCCVYDPAEMHRSLLVFERGLANVQDIRAAFGKPAGSQPFTVHTSSSSSVLFGVHYDLLRVGGLLFGDVTISDGGGGATSLPGPHRTLLWKSHITALRWSVPGERFSRCTASNCQAGPSFQRRVLLGLVPVGAFEFSDSNVVSGAFREKLPLLEKSTDSLLVEIPSTTRTFQQAFEGMEVLLCAENCVQGLFNVPEHVPRILVQDPSIDMSFYCPSMPIGEFDALTRVHGKKAPSICTKSSSGNVEIFTTSLPTAERVLHGSTRNHSSHTPSEK